MSTTDLPCLLTSGFCSIISYTTNRPLEELPLWKYCSSKMSRDWGMLAK
jgi:hypothetical protein